MQAAGEWAALYVTCNAGNESLSFLVLALGWARALHVTFLSLRPPRLRSAPRDFAWSPLDNDIIATECVPITVH